MSVITLERPGRAARGAPPAAEATDGRRHLLRQRNIGVWLLRIPLVTPYVFMAPEWISLALGRRGAEDNIALSAADVLGMSALMFFFMMLTVTPLHTVAGWRWHRALRRDYGVAMFVVAASDLMLAALTTGNEFHGGFLNRVGGHTFLLAGTLSTLLLVPLALTANKRAQRWLGPHWKKLHRLVYVIWLTILLHLAFLFALRTLFIYALLVSAPLFVIRLPQVRDWWVAARKAHAHRAALWVSGLLMLGLYGTGYALLIRELISVGMQAFTQTPSS